MDTLGTTLGLEFGNCLDKFRRRRARVTGDHANARRKRGIRKGLVSHNQFLMHLYPLDVAGALRQDGVCRRDSVRNQRDTVYSIKLK